jgi:4-amino-4-deoxy-L-arabinose transferase-like glycosyltransferase
LSTSQKPQDLQQETEPRGRRALIWLFLFALAIRWIYALGIYAAMADGGLVVADGRGYLEDARKFVDLLQSGNIQPSEWIGVNTAVMPLFSWTLALHVAAFGNHAPLAYVMSQGLIDSATCLLVSGIAATFSPRLAMPSGIAAAVNPTSVVLAGLVYTDTMFVFFVAVMLLGAVRWIKTPTLRWALIIGSGVGGAALTRIMIAPWVPFLCFFLLAVQLWQRSLASRNIGHVMAIGAVFCLCIAPVALRNVIYYDTWALTSQSGYHFAYWVVPLVKEAKDGTPWERTVRELQKKALDQDTGSMDNFKSSIAARRIGEEALKDLGYAAIAKAWINGAIINVASPALVTSPPVAKLPRTGFYATAGSTPAEKIFNFVFRSDNSLFSLVVIVGALSVAVVRMIQVVGFLALVRTGSMACVLLLFFWACYVLAINGPVAAPKYRLPMEPALCVLTGAGFVAILDWWRRRRRTVAA